jgi:eukaryotic-like serine/threonine-protein kinase
MSDSELEPLAVADRPVAVPPVGDRLGDYQVLFELAKGGMATVHLARQSGDAGFERLVAIKRVHPHLVSDPEVFAMASDEARLAALVRHPNVVAVIGVFDTRGELVLVQEYVEGFSLARLLRALGKLEQHLPRGVAARIALDLARGLAATHGARDLRGEPLAIVHRDVSPQNVLVGTDGAARLIDFGIARSERRMTATRTGILKGKLSYMAPEQIAEEGVDQRADLYAAGLVLYEMLTGVRAFEASDDASLMAKILSGAIDLERVPDEWRAVLERALARAPADRFADAGELARAIREVGGAAGEEEVGAFVVDLFSTELEVLRERIASSIASVDLEAASLADAAAEQLATERELPTAGAPSAGAVGEREELAKGAAPRARGGGRPAALVAGALFGAGLFGAGWLLARRQAGDPDLSRRPGSFVEAPLGAPETARLPHTSTVAESSSASPLASASVSTSPALAVSAEPSTSAPPGSTSAPARDAASRPGRASSAPKTSAAPVVSSPTSVPSVSSRPDLQPSPYGPK